MIRKVKYRIRKDSYTAIVYILFVLLLFFWFVLFAFCLIYFFFGFAELSLVISLAHLEKKMYLSFSLYFCVPNLRWAFFTNEPGVGSVPTTPKFLFHQSSILDHKRDATIAGRDEPSERNKSSQITENNCSGHLISSKTSNS